jgi:hypothetical protein
MQYLQLLRDTYTDEKIPPTETIFLLTDQFRGHLTEKVKAKAVSLNIKLWYIPANCTDVLQPLDRKVFGPLKAKAKKEYRTYAADLGKDVKRGLAEACTEMMKAWTEVSPECIQSAFAHIIPEYQASFAVKVDYEDPDGDTQDSPWMKG